MIARERERAKDVRYRDKVCGMQRAWDRDVRGK